MRQRSLVSDFKKRSESFQSDQAFLDLMEPPEEIQKKEFTKSELIRLEKTKKKKMSQVIDLISENAESTFHLVKCPEEVGNYALWHDLEEQENEYRKPFVIDPKRLLSRNQSSILLGFDFFKKKAVKQITLGIKRIEKEIAKEAALYNIEAIPENRDLFTVFLKYKSKLTLEAKEKIKRFNYLCTNLYL